MKRSAAATVEVPSAMQASVRCTRRPRRSLALVAQRRPPGAARLHCRTRSARPSGRCSSRVSLSTGSGPLSAGAAHRPAWHRSPPVVQQGIELGGHELAHLAQAVQQLAGIALRPDPVTARDPAPDPRRLWAAGGSAGRPGTGCGAPRGAGTRSPRPAGRRWSAFIRPRATRRCRPRRVDAGADLGKVPAAHHQHAAAR